MNKKWRWFDLFALINSLIWISILILLFVTSITEKENQATIISGIALLILTAAAITFLTLRYRSKLDSKSFRIFATIASVIYALFIISLFIPTEHENLKE